MNQLDPVISSPSEVSGIKIYKGIIEAGSMDELKSSAMN
jgi:hypothetical protein